MQETSIYQIPTLDSKLINISLIIMIIMIIIIKNNNTNITKSSSSSARYESTYLPFFFSFFSFQILSLFSSEGRTEGEYFVFLP